MMIERGEAPGIRAMSEALGVVTCWVETLHGRGDLLTALDLLVGLMNGQRGVLLRLHLDVAAQTTMAQIDRGGAGRPAAGKLSFSQYLLGHGIGQAQPGSVWLLSEVAPELAVRDRLADRISVAHPQTREVMAAVLEPRQRTADIVEIHFTRGLAPREAETLGMLVGIVSRAWRHRNGNMFPAAEPGRVAPAPAEQVAGNILGPENPAGLSRSEYRVCSLVCRGMNAKRISDSLRISESTVRSHLRSIYAKTGSAGHAQLMYRLLGTGPGAALDGARGGARGLQEGTHGFVALPASL